MTTEQESVSMTINRVFEEYKQPIVRCLILYSTVKTWLHRFSGAYWINSNLPPDWVANRYKQIVDSAITEFKILVSEVYKYFVLCNLSREDFNKVGELNCYETLLSMGGDFLQKHENVLNVAYRYNKTDSKADVAEGV